MLTQSYAHGASTKPLLGETLGVNFDLAAEKWGERDALIVRHQNVRWTYSELKNEVDDFAAGLLALGGALRPHERARGCEAELHGSHVYVRPVRPL